MCSRVVATAAPAQAAPAVLILEPIEGGISTAHLAYRISVLLFIPSFSANLGATWQPWSTRRPWDCSGESPTVHPGAGLGHQPPGDGGPSTQWEQANTHFVFNVFLLQNIERGLEALGIKVHSPWLSGWGLFLPQGSRRGTREVVGDPSDPRWVGEAVGCCCSWVALTP